MNLPTTDYMKQVIEFYEEIEKLGVKVKSRGRYIDYYDLMVCLREIWNNLPSDKMAHLALLFTDLNFKYDITQIKKIKKHKSKVPLSFFLRPITIREDSFYFEHIAFSLKGNKFIVTDEKSEDMWHFQSTLTISNDDVVRVLNIKKYNVCNSVDEFLEQTLETKIIGGKIGNSEMVLYQFSLT